MKPRPALERELDRLERMLSDWRCRLRHEAQFWPQFRVLADRVTDGLDRVDRRYAEQRIANMLTSNGCDPGKRHGEGW